MEPQAESAMTPSEVFRRFISLGDDCEFGAAQQDFGFKPLSLLTFAFNTLDGLTRALSDRLREIADPVRFDLIQWDTLHGLKEYVLWHKTYETAIHTHRYQGMHDPEETFRLSIDRLLYLRGEFFDDLRRGDRVAVFKSAFEQHPKPGKPTYKSIRQLQELILKGYGPTRLLWVAVAERSELVGAVHPLGETLLKGYISRFVDWKAPQIESAEWLQLCTNTIRLLQDDQPGR